MNEFDRWMFDKTLADDNFPHSKAGIFIIDWGNRLIAGACRVPESLLGAGTCTSPTATEVMLRQEAAKRYIESCRVTLAEEMQTATYYLQRHVHDCFMAYMLYPYVYGI